MTFPFLESFLASPATWVLGWAATFLLHSTLLIGLAWGAIRLGFVRSPHLRDTLWKTALIGGVLSASLQSVTGHAFFVHEVPVTAASDVGVIETGASPAASLDAGDLLVWLTSETETLAGSEPALTVMPVDPVDLQARLLGGGGLAEGLPPAGIGAGRPQEFLAAGADEERFSPGSPFSLPGLEGLTAATRAVLAIPAAWILDQAALLLLGLWLLGAAWALARLIRAHLRLRRSLHGRREVEDPALISLLDRLREAGNVRRSVRLTVHPRLPGPIAFGRGEICLPERALAELDRDQQESVLAHELGHVVRRDPLWLAAGGVLQALFFFQPLLRLARRRLQEEAEFLCDEWAVVHTGRGLILARCLAKVATWVSVRPHAAPVAGMAVQDSPLVRRVERLLDESRRPSRGLPPTARVAVLILAVGTAALFAPGLSARVRPEAPPVVVSAPPAPAAVFLPADSVITGFRLAPDGSTVFSWEPSKFSWEAPEVPMAEVLLLPEAPNAFEFAPEPTPFTAVVPGEPDAVPEAPFLADVPSTELYFGTEPDASTGGGVVIYDDGEVSHFQGGAEPLRVFVTGRPMIGVTIGDVDEALRVHLGLGEDEGVLVSKVIEGGAAEEAGIEPYDIVLDCDGEPVNRESLIEAIRAKENGETLELTVLRKGERRTVEVEVRESESPFGGRMAPNVRFSPDVRFPEVPAPGKPLAPRVLTPRNRDEALRELREVEFELQRLIEQLRNREGDAATNVEQLEELKARAERLSRERAIVDRQRAVLVEGQAGHAEALEQYADQLRARAAEAHARSRHERREASRLHDHYSDVTHQVEAAGVAILRAELGSVMARMSREERDRLDEALEAAMEETADELVISVQDGDVRIENEARELRDVLRSQITIQGARLGVQLDAPARNAVDDAVEAAVAGLFALEIR